MRVYSNGWTMLKHDEFVTKEKAMVIAPAGHGKTHSIVECLKHIPDGKRQLILTHTHAGVASVKEKLTKERIPTSLFQIETISSFTQKYVLSFYKGEDMPSQSDSDNYYPFLLEKAFLLFKLSPIRMIISTSFGGLFVDEYQDCTITQHNLIIQLSEILPTRIFGDQLQGIFDFSGPLVDLELPEHMGGFLKERFELTTPHRWLKANKASLGEDLRAIRELILAQNPIDLRERKSIELLIAPESDFNNFRSDYYQTLSRLLTSEQNLLIIHPLSANIEPRISMIQRLQNRVDLIESIDHRMFYALSEEADGINEINATGVIISMCNKLFGPSSLSRWFNDKGTALRRKTDPNEKAIADKLQRRLDGLSTKISFYEISGIITDISQLSGVKCYRRDLLHSLCRALSLAETDGITVLKAMENKRNIVRRVGRKVYGRCIGTTLLTKGLEFDTVVLVNAHQFPSHKHLYVALTRATRRLIVIANNPILNPYLRR